MRDALYYIRQHITNPLNKQTLDGYIGFEVGLEEALWRSRSQRRKNMAGNLILIGLHRS